MSNKRPRAPSKSRLGCVNQDNDLLVQELKVLQSRTRESSHLFHNYSRAVGSLQRCEQTIQSAREALKLRHIGNFIANQIQAILNKHRAAASSCSSSSSSAVATATSDADPVVADSPQPSFPGSSTGTHRSACSSFDSDGAVIETSQTQAQPSAMQHERMNERQYAPTIGKQPWLVLVALRRSHACNEMSAVEKSFLLDKMRLEGYDGSLNKLQTCLASLTGTHRVVAKSSTGRYYLTAKGITSADDCVLAIPRATAPATATPLPFELSSSRGVSDKPASESTAGALDQHVITLCSSDEDEGDDEDDDCATIVHASPPATQTDSEVDAEPFCSADTTSSTSSTVSPPSPTSTPASELEPLSRDLMQSNDRWELVLILDHREILSRRNRCLMESKLLEKNVTCKVRALNIGDALWVARRTRMITGETHEFVLNVIVERKEMQDLSGSIMDKRYLEQKSRLKECGLTHVIYLVEGSFTHQHTAVRSGGLSTVLCRTQVQDDFFVQWCRSADETIAFLASVHQSLLLRFPFSNPERDQAMRHAGSTSVFGSIDGTRGGLRSLLSHPLLTFDEFNFRFRKKTQFTTGEVYQMMLMQIPGLSCVKAQGLATAFPSFHSLLDAMQSGDQQVGNVSYGKTQRRFGKKTEFFLNKLLLGTSYEQEEPAASQHQQQ